jgi:hypothetical protein
VNRVAVAIDVEQTVVERWQSCDRFSDINARTGDPE